MVEYTSAEPLKAVTGETPLHAQFGVAPGNPDRTCVVLLVSAVITASRTEVARASWVTVGVVAQEDTAYPFTIAEVPLKALTLVMEALELKPGPWKAAVT